MKYLKFYSFILVSIFVMALLSGSGQAKTLQYSKAYTVEQIYPGGDTYKDIEGEIPATAVYKNNRLIGYAYVTSDVVPSLGYSGKPIKTLIAIDLDGNIIGAKVIEHHEPILLAGISMETFDDFVSRHVGLNVFKKKTELSPRSARRVDLVSGATVTAMVVNDSILRSGQKLLSMLSANKTTTTTTTESAMLKTGDYQEKSWQELTGDGSLRRLSLSQNDVNQAFVSMGGPAEDVFSEYEGNEDKESFIDLYTGLITPPSIGRSLLGDDEYKWLTEKKLSNGEQAIIIAANGAFSFRGSGFVRGGIFDRILLVQGQNTFRFRDRDYKRIGDFVQKDSPDFNEIGIFILHKTAAESNNFDPTKPWRLELLVSRHTGAIKKIFSSFSLEYQLPDEYIQYKPKYVNAEKYTDNEPALWQRVWHDRIIDIVILSFALLLLTIVFFSQDFLARRPVLLERIKLGFLLFSLFWIGGYAHAQLSIVNVLTFIHNLLHGFNLEFFLLEPLIFILWSAVAISLLFWGRGVFCGWLCPFGALQELLNRCAQLVGIKQFKIPFYIHERLWTIKYIIFLGLLALSLFSMAAAELASEVEPFKTVLLLHFGREWYFSLYAGLLLGIGLFNERFFCRYLCPLGAGLAIPANNRLFRWLKRRKECGTQCQRCAVKCSVQAIHPSGEINPNECLYCMGCQVIYYDKNTCPPLIQLRLKHEKRMAEAAEKSRQEQE